MDAQRPAIKLSDETHAPAEVEAERDTLRPIGDTLPPSGDRVTFVDKDETVGLVALLHHAQHATLSAARHIDEARDANDEELASFLEASLKLDLKRIAQAKQLLLTRLQADSDASQAAIREARHGRIHYVSIPDAPASDLNREE